jgi:phosphatidate cytidylyltransferase
MNHKEIKTGRNLPLATFVSLVLALLLVASLWFDRWFFALLVALASYFAVSEMISLLNLRDTRSKYLVLFASVVLPITSYWQGLVVGVGLSLPLLFIAAILALLQGFEDFTHRFTSVVLMVLYVPVLLSFMVEMARFENGFALVFSLALLNSAVDTGGYFAGILFGKRPLFKILSPKKTIEGLLGSFALTLLVAVLLIPMLIPISWVQGILIGFSAVIAGVVGDLFESALKRERGVKDASHVIPGHGGVLDRIDALLFNAPILWFFLIVVFELGVV